MSKYILLVKKSGQVIKLASKDFPIQRRGGVGVKAVILAKGDAVVAAVALES
ncbi:hypothetical protein HYW42_00915 [Candidatus Daviesbacteria bacterium]|nr:hypothetical protein [Candidatus Daviesbacteria bacterium]